MKMTDSLLIEPLDHTAVPGRISQASGMKHDVDVAVEIVGRCGQQILLGRIFAEGIPMFWPRVRVSLVVDGKRIKSKMVTMRGEFAFHDLPDGKIRIEADVPGLSC